MTTLLTDGRQGIRDNAGCEAFQIKVREQMNESGGGKELTILGEISAHPELPEGIDPDLFEAVMACVLQRVAENRRSITVGEVIADGSVTDVLIADDLDTDPGKAHDAVVLCLSVLSAGNIHGSSTKGLGKIKIDENGETVVEILQPDFFTVETIKQLVAEVRELTRDKPEDEND